jgi:hypothetical protein
MGLMLVIVLLSLLRVVVLRRVGEVMLIVSLILLLYEMAKLMLDTYLLFTP